MLLKTIYLLILLFTSSNSTEARVAIGYSGIDTNFFRVLVKYIKLINAAKDNQAIKSQIDTWKKFMGYEIHSSWRIITFWHRMCYYIGNPALAQLCYYLGKFNIDMYVSQQHYITIKLFSHNYGMCITPCWSIKSYYNYNGEIIYRANTSGYCIGASWAILEFGWGYIKKYKNMQKIYYGFEVSFILPQLDILFRYSPFIYKFDNDMAIKISLLNISLINNFANLCVSQYNIATIHLDKKTNHNAEDQPKCLIKVIPGSDCDKWLKSNNLCLKSSINAKEYKSFSSRLKKFFMNWLLNISITFYFFDNQNN